MAEGITEAINTATDVIPYMLSILPDAILPASGVYALFTLSSAFGTFFASLIEARIILLGIHIFAHHYLPGVDFDRYRPAVDRNSFCTNKITRTIGNDDIMEGPAGHKYVFPSTPMYMLSVASAYVFNTLSNQSKELEALGPAFSTRYYVSITFLLALVSLVGSFRFMYGCEEYYNIIGSSILGLIIGTLLVMQNKRLFGDSSINLLGIPYLRNRSAGGKKLYVCPK